MVSNLRLNTDRISSYFRLFMGRATNIQSVFFSGNISGIHIRSVVSSSYDFI